MEVKCAGGGGCEHGKKSGYQTNETKLRIDATDNQILCLRSNQRALESDEKTHGLGRRPAYPEGDDVDHELGVELEIAVAETSGGQLHSQREAELLDDGLLDDPAEVLAPKLNALGHGVVGVGLLTEVEDKGIVQALPGGRGKCCQVAQRKAGDGSELNG